MVHQQVLPELLYGQVPTELNESETLGGGSDASQFPEEFLAHHDHVTTYDTSAIDTVGVQGVGFHTTPGTECPRGSERVSLFVVFEGHT